MSDPMLVFAFLMILFTPCLIAFANWASESGELDLCQGQGRELRRMGRLPMPLQAMLPEAALAEDFTIRSFPKGLARRRILVRDSESGVKLTIAQVREAAAELVKLGGFVVAHELALVVAALVAAGKSVATAAREAMEAARNTYAWMAWNGVLTQNQVWDVGAPAPSTAPVSGIAQARFAASRAA